MKCSYATSGTCSWEINYELEGDIIHNVEFMGGCNGNLKAISKLVEGRKAEDIIALLEGNTCGFKRTSCADQFAKALKESLEEAK